MCLADGKDQKTTLGFGTPARKIEDGFSALECRTVHPAEQMKPQPGGGEPSTIPLVACLGFRALFPKLVICSQPMKQISGAELTFAKCLTVTTTSAFNI